MPADEGSKGGLTGEQGEGVGATGEEFGGEDGEFVRESGLEGLDMREGAVLAGVEDVGEEVGVGGG